MSGATGQASLKQKFRFFLKFLANVVLKSDLIVNCGIREIFNYG